MPSSVNLSRFDLVTLRLFVTAVDGGSLSAGARRFGISVAAASKRMADLEAHVGMALLLRGKKGVVPTAAGQALLEQAIRVIAEVERLALTLDDYRRGAGGSLRIWANPSAFAGFLPALLARFLVGHPSVKVDLEETLSQEAVRAVVAGTTEVAIVGENTPLEGLASFVCDVDELVLLLPAQHALARRTTVSLREAAALDFVGLNRSTSLMRQIAALAGSVGCALKVRVQVRNFDAVCRMVSAGIGAAIVPRAAGAPHVRSMGLALVQLDGIPVSRRLLLATRDPASLSPAARAFVELARQRLSEGA
ncbi:LysR family transcriptional regulator [Propionivibrio dicarboxylicus]|uniref:Transcriptional regulator, LysR family n=1 Tax=Propionivibrio dicarboxylicus TaxID=83767 RepID=A0A1G7WUR4_9RHOO|nr:LysR family transcriptional regulator [Propionivibrio dicarboxylicus]SDG75604.1 transcriptional regulator, LysR family [Propionivibrio dicarboxylicus]